ncbi:energy-coupling factor transporter transmembrane component T family protein [Aquibacillus albus]|uniref:Energy-coupling factor transport system permease protein n=1 Tax=Aquibacillus albus TaxID=1168171 RepID=A0ABS2MVS3_9BACI|nr:energy-coupling factor transporter transmembrane component T [Aquibacillus albus]MBM7570009.1 energy-coupling factor transport system permease protein [Aquibacillus albus]
MKSIKDLLSKITVENIKIELMRTAYGNKDTFMGKLDPRVAIVWYLIFAIIPWLFWNNTILLGFLLYMVVLLSISRVSPLIIILLAFGLVTEAGYIIFVSVMFGGDLTAAMALLTFTLKLTIISLASIAVFASMDPEKFSDALMSFRLPGQVCFGISYGYRMLPILIEEYNNIFNSFRLRGKVPEDRGVIHWKRVVYYCKTAVFAFYPMMLNTAKRTRTTVEALEVKGFTYSLKHEEVRKLKLSYLRVQPRDIYFFIFTIFLIITVIYIGHLYPIEREIHPL